MTNSFQQKRTIYFRYPSDKAYTFIEGDGDEQFAYRAFEDDYTNRIFGHKTPYKNLKLDVQEGSHPSSMSREDYSNAFKRIEQQFANGSLEKIILSRVIKSKIDTTNIESIFERLCELYPNAFVYLGDFGAEGMWGGATPERLLSYENNIASTVALAGTKTTADPQAWTDKERVEHRHVEQFIVSLHDSSLSPLTNKSEVYLSRAGHLYHLKSDYEFEIDRTHFEEFINRLHPTPAICGLPREASRKTILEIESHSRNLYTGFLGYVSNDPKVRFELYVNLRCFQLRPNTLYTYVGGGITESSIEENEWQETVEKSKTIGRVFEN